MMLLAEFHIFPAACHTIPNGNTLPIQLKMVAMEANRQQAMKNEADLGLQHQVSSNINTLFGLLSSCRNML